MPIHRKNINATRGKAVLRDKQDQRKKAKPVEAKDDLTPIRVGEKRTKIKPEQKKRGNKPGSNGGGGKRNAKIFDKTNLDLVASLAASGVSLSQIGAYFGISHSGIYTLKNRMPELQQAYEKGLATGIASVAQKVRQEAEAGNMQAAIFYLKAKAGWSEKVQVDVSTKIELEAATIERINNLNSEQRVARLQELKALRNLESETIDVEVV